MQTCGLLIDGYTVIRRDPEPSALERRSPKEERCGPLRPLARVALAPGCSGGMSRHVGYSWLNVRNQKEYAEPGA